MTELPEYAGPVLTGLARNAIATTLGLKDRVSPNVHMKLVSSVSMLTLDVENEPWLSEKGASFVTLRIGGNLRGCIGSLVAYQPLKDDVRQNARAAAFEDPRFYPLSVKEFEQVHIEVSVLSAPETMSFSSREEALEKLRPGVDGVILSAGRRRATFLPQVWDELPDREEFITHLLMKAGLPPTFWDDSVRIERYTVTAFEEPED